MDSIHGKQANWGKEHDFITAAWYGRTFMNISRSESTSVLIISSRTATSAHPAESLAKNLNAEGISTLRMAYQDSLPVWKANVTRADVVVIVIYGPPDDGVIGKLGCAAAIGRPVIRWWVGSDVLNCIKDAAARHQAHKLDRFVAANVAVAPHLTDELKDCGIIAEAVPSVLDPSWAESAFADLSPKSPASRNRILVYLPTRGMDFYHGPLIERLIRENDDFQFVLVGGTPQEFASDCLNVENLGWAKDVTSIHHAVGCLIRITKHDGMPRMVLESLLAGNFVIYAWPLAGCWPARTYDEVQRQLIRLRTTNGPNEEGRSAVRKLIESNPGHQFATIVGRVRSARCWRTKIRGTTTAMRVAAASGWRRFSRLMDRDRTTSEGLF